MPIRMVRSCRSTSDIEAYFGSQFPLNACYESRNHTNLIGGAHFLQTDPYA